MIRIPVLAAIPFAFMVVVLAVVASIANNLVLQGMPVLFPFIQEEFGANRAQLGLLTSGVLVGGTGTSLLMGWMADTMGVRRIVPVALIGMAGVVLLFSQIQSLTQGVLLVLLVGVASSAVSPGSAKAIMDWVPPHTRGISMGIKETSVPISGISVAVLLPFLALLFSWRTAMMSVAITIAVIGMVYFVLYRDRTGISPVAKKSGLKSSTILVAKNRNIWLAALSYAALMAVHLAFVSYLILFLIEELDMSEAVAASFLAIAWGGSASGRVVWGLVSDWLGGRWVVVVVLVGALSMVSMALMVWLPSDASHVLVAMVVFLVGVTALGWPGLYNALVIELAGPGLAGTGMGFFSIITRLGALIPPFFGLVVDRTGFLRYRLVDDGWDRQRWYLGANLCAAPAQT